GTHTPQPMLWGTAESPHREAGEYGFRTPRCARPRNDDHRTARSRGKGDSDMTEALRRKLTNAGRVLTSQDQGDFVAGHVSVRDPDDPQRFLMKPATIGLEEMTPETIITVDLDGRKIGGAMPRHNEVFIHSEVLRARSDIAAVAHTHAPHAVAFSSLGRELVPVNNEAGYFHKCLPVFSETTD